MTNIPAVGIDLGTTFSCVSVYRKQRPEIIPDRDGDRIIPSIVYFDYKTGEVSVGNIADELLPACPGNGLFDVKRFMGRRFEDEFVSRYIESKQTHFSVVKGADDQAAFEIQIADQKVIKTPEEVSAELIKYLKNAASDYLGGEVTEAVISVPAYFSNAQRKATKRAAELAGLKVLKLITEPTAAAIHYVSDKEKDKSKVLVFDFGGGTLDVSLININKNTFEVKAVYGDTLLGGRNIDETLFDYFYKDFLEKDKKKTIHKKFARRLNNMCINLKKKLSSKEEFTLDIDRYDGGTSDYSLTMTRTKFEEINKHIFEQALDIVKLCLDDTALSKSGIDEVVLVGGSTRIPKVREMLGSYFDNKKLKTDLNPDEAVAAGACIHAALLKEECRDLEKYKITEVTPMSLGLVEKGELMDVFLPKNSPLPATASKLHETIHNNQKNAKFRICEGERKNVAYNNELGQFMIDDLPLKRAGDVTFTIKFYLDEDGILDVSATEKSTGKANKLVVTMGQFRFSERRIKMTVEDAKKHKLEDETFQKFKLRKNILEKKCRHILYDVNRISSKSDQALVEKDCNSFLNSSASFDFTEYEHLEAKFKEFYDSISEILKNNNMLELQ